MLILLTLACASTPKGPLLFTGATLPGGAAVTIRVEDGRIMAMEGSAEGATTIDLTGKVLVPAVVDSHVHLAFLPEAKAMADGGIGAVVDWGAPIAALASPPDGLQHLGSGPMITAVQGYPTQSWGSAGYGIECGDQAEALAALDRVAAAGARVVKLPLSTGARLDRETLAAVVDAAHARGLKVGTHAMADADVALAAELDIDVLVHVPTQALSASTISAWSSRTVISTVDAFGGGVDAVANLSKLREAGATILYGTDFGNSRTAGIQRAELEQLVAAGLDPAAILAATTEAPTRYFGFELGLEVGKPASFLVLAADPLGDPLVLASPEAVWIEGKER